MMCSEKGLLLPLKAGRTFNHLFCSLSGSWPIGSIRWERAEHFARIRAASITQLSSTCSPVPFHSPPHQRPSKNVRQASNLSRFLPPPPLENLTISVAQGPSARHGKACVSDRSRPAHLFAGAANMEAAQHLLRPRGPQTQPTRRTQPAAPAGPLKSSPLPVGPPRLPFYLA